MPRIFKYPVVATTGQQAILMHGDNGRPIHFGEQAAQLTLWAEVHENLPKTPNKYFLAFTGDRVPSDGVHVGTVQSYNGLLWHLYIVGGVG